MNHWTVLNPSVEFEWFRLSPWVPVSNVWDFVLLAGILVRLSLGLSLGNPTGFGRKMLDFTGQARGPREGLGAAFFSLWPAARAVYHRGLNVGDSVRQVWMTSPRARRVIIQACKATPHWGPLWRGPAGRQTEYSGDVSSSAVAAQLYLLLGLSSAEPHDLGHRVRLSPSSCHILPKGDDSSCPTQ